MTGIVIPHYGDDKVLGNLLFSLQEYYRGIANGLQLNEEGFSDKDGKRLGLISQHNDTVIIDNSKNNQGFTTAVNLGIEYFNLLSDVSNIENYDFIWVLNNDTEVLENTLQPMIDRMVSNKRCGIVSSKTLFMDNPDRIHHGGTLQCWPNGIHKVGLKSLNQLNIPTREKWVTFCSVLLRVKMIQQIGLLDERMFNFCSDADYCYRARYAGWEVWYEPKSEVLHSIGQSQNPNEKQQIIMFKDMIAFRDKWIGTACFNDLDKEVFNYDSSKPD